MTLKEACRRQLRLRRIGGYGGDLSPQKWQAEAKTPAPPMLANPKTKFSRGCRSFFCDLQNCLFRQKNRYIQALTLSCGEPQSEFFGASKKGKSTRKTTKAVVQTCWTTALNFSSHFSFGSQSMPESSLIRRSKYF